MPLNDASDSAGAPQTDKWEVQLRKGCLELAILGALWGGRLYGLEILRRMKGNSHLALPASTLYPLLARLKAEGLLQSQWEEAEAGHARKYYQLTPSGRLRAVEMARAWSEFSASLGDLLSPLLKEEAR